MNISKYLSDAANYAANQTGGTDVQIRVCVVGVEIHATAAPTATMIGAHRDSKKYVTYIDIGRTRGNALIEGIKDVVASIDAMTFTRDDTFRLNNGTLSDMFFNHEPAVECYIDFGPYGADATDEGVSAMLKVAAEFAASLRTIMIDSRTPTPTASQLFNDFMNRV